MHFLCGLWQASLSNFLHGNFQVGLISAYIIKKTLLWKVKSNSLCFQPEFVCSMYLLHSLLVLMSFGWFIGNNVDGSMPFYNHTCLSPPHIQLLNLQPYVQSLMQLHHIEVCMSFMTGAINFNLYPRKLFAPLSLHGSEAYVYLNPSL